MSQADVDVVRAVHPRSGTEITRFFAEDAEADAVRTAWAARVTDDFRGLAASVDMAGLGFVDTGGVDGLVKFWRDWLEPWDAYWTEVEEFVDLDDGRVLVLIRDRGRLRDSGSEIEMNAAAIWTVRDGKIARIEFYSNREDGRRAAGL